MSTRPDTQAHGDVTLPDALVREVEWIDPGRLAAALEATGAPHVSLLESGLPESAWGIWTFLAWEPAAALEHDGKAWRDARTGPAIAPGAFFEALAAAPAHPWETLSSAWEQARAPIAGADSDVRAAAPPG